MSLTVLWLANKGSLKVSKAVCRRVMQRKISFVTCVTYVKLLHRKRKKKSFQHWFFFFSPFSKYFTQKVCCQTSRFERACHLAELFGFLCFFQGVMSDQDKRIFSGTLSSLCCVNYPKKKKIKQCLHNTAVMQQKQIVSVEDRCPFLAARVVFFSILILKMPHRITFAPLDATEFNARGL